MKRRILFINYEFPPTGGGGGRANAAVARELAILGHEVFVLTARYGGLPRIEPCDGYTIYRIPALRFRKDRASVIEMLSFLLSSMIWVSWSARASSFHVCIPFFTIPCAPAAYLLNRKYKTPYIVATCGGDIPGFSAGKLLVFYHALTQGLIRFLWRKAGCVVATCASLKCLIEASSERRDIEIIPNGVDNSFFAIHRSSAFSKSPFIFITTCRLSPQKGLHHLIRAFAKLGTDCNAELWIVGDGPLRSSLKRLAEPSLGSVRFLGWQSPEAIRMLYERVHAFVLPSYAEGFSLAVLEAMAARLPVIATRVSGLEELVEHGRTGLLVPVADDSALAEALSAFCKRQGDLEKMGKHGKEKAMNFTWDKIARQFEAVLLRAERP